VAENGDDPASSLTHIAKVLAEFPECAEDLLQQTNFRLVSPVSAKDLSVWLINVTKFHVLAPKYVLYSLVPEPQQAEGGV
jgi:hypothetical protein